MNNKLVGARIKEARIDRDLSIEEVASAIGLNKSTISRYERGDIENPKLMVIEAIAQVLHTNPSWLVGKSDDRTYTPPNSFSALFTPCNLFSPLKGLREKRGLSIEEVAYKIGISAADYAKIEKGYNTDCITLVRIAEFYCCDINFVLAYDGVFCESEVINQALVTSNNLDVIRKKIANSLTSTELSMLDKFRHLPTAARDNVLNTLEFEYSRLPGETANSTAKEA